MAALKTLQALIFLGILATSCTAQAPAPAPIMLFPPVESPSPVITPTAEPPSPVPVASPPVMVTEPTPAPATPPTVSSPTKSPKTSPVASPPKPEGMVPSPSVPTPTPTPSPTPAPEGPIADSALTNKAFLVSTVIAGALYAVVLA
ncbi:Classical arabinogalactan protein 3 [Raphanus sativus]|uniref:Classical arabinogalactan protein 3-like n=1 Tax=Raphanus sativus TaxID=3726 RepID=A0A6J0KNI4_RAPSA|nr:classical arabinogalactan protein 3-like [Raphanus sativus]KAJ4880161.1 Classical arabinogalactan protein 3 [Raphanus sativus]